VHFVLIVLRKMLFVLSLILVHLFILICPFSFLLELSIVSPGRRGRRRGALGKSNSKEAYFLKR